MAEKIKNKISVYGFPALWEKRTPLLPQSLRTAWASDRLPTWVIEELSLPEGSTFAGLDSSVWDRNRTIKPRVQNFLKWNVHARRDQISSLAVLAASPPPEINLHKIPWKVRTRNCLEAEGLPQDLLRLGRITFGELFGIRGMGAISILDFACCLEAAMISYSSLQERTKQVEQDIISSIDEAWADQISEQDPRFAHFFPSGEGTIVDRLDSLTTTSLNSGSIDRGQLYVAIEQSRELVRKLEQMPLETLLRNYMSGLLKKPTGVRLEAFISRFGWGGIPPRTLEETGGKLGVTRERVRQIEDQVRKRFPGHPVVMPALDKALDLLYRKAPLDARDASSLLKKKGVTSGFFHPASVLAAAKDCGRTPLIYIERVNKQDMVIANLKEGISNTLVAVAKKLSGASGVSNIHETVSWLNQNGLEIEPEQARYLLERCHEFQFLGDDWFWYPRGKVHRNRLRNVTRKMLAIASSIDIASLRDGVRRVFRWRNATGMRTRELVVPPKNVLEAFYQAHPEFSVDESGQTSCLEPLDYKIELGHTEQVIVNVLRASPVCILDRETLVKNCLARGVNDSTISAELSYSPVVMHLGTDLWSLRGVKVDPAAVEAMRVAKAQQPRERRTLDHGWTPAGNLWIATKLPAILSSFVLYIPANVRRILTSGEYQAESDTGSPFGTIKIGDAGQSWGYSPYLSQHGADEGDYFIVEFDLINKKATLRLGDYDLLQSFSGE